MHNLTGLDVPPADMLTCVSGKYRRVSTPSSSSTARDGRQGTTLLGNTARLAEKSGPGGPGEDLCGELIACVNHIGTGSTGGHYVSYTKLDQVF